MKLRELMIKDAPLMLEWMHDETVTSNLGTNFSTKTIGDCLAFIESSWNSPTDLHLAVTNDCDEYMGTVSLKHISKLSHTAEFAITIRSCAMGKGYSRFAMEQILAKGLEELELAQMFWCVSQYNSRAVRFYDKNGYSRAKTVPQAIKNNYTSEQADDFYWYVYPCQTSEVTA